MKYIYKNAIYIMVINISICQSIFSSNITDSLNNEMKSGNIEATAIIAEIYRRDGNITKALDIFQKIENDSHPITFYNLGIMFMDTLGVEANHSKANEYITEAFRLFNLDIFNQNPYCQLDIGQIYRNGFISPPDFTEAAKWIRKSAEQGNAIAQYQLGKCLNRGLGLYLNKEEAVQWYLKSSLQGYPDAQEALAACYIEGDGVPINIEEGIKWLTKAAEQGLIFPQVSLGFYYFKGINGAINYEEGIKWLTKAAEQGNDNALYLLGDAYTFGHGVEKDEKKGIELYLKSAAKYNPEAAYRLSRAYKNGWGVEIDEKKANEWSYNMPRFAAIKKGIPFVEKKHSWLTSSSFVFIILISLLRIFLVFYKKYYTTPRKTNNFL